MQFWFAARVAGEIATSHFLIHKILELQGHSTSPTPSMRARQDK